MCERESVCEREHPPLPPPLVRSQPQTAWQGRECRVSAWVISRCSLAIVRYPVSLESSAEERRWDLLKGLKTVT